MFSLEELSEEDRALKEDLEMLVTRLKEKDQSLWGPSKFTTSLTCRSNFQPKHFQHCTDQK